MKAKKTRSTENPDTQIVSIRAEIWHALLKIVGRQIDPERAEVSCIYGQIVDPYGVYHNLADECACIGRLYFARSPGSELWIEFGDLPEATREALRNKSPRVPDVIDEIPF